MNDTTINRNDTTINMNVVKTCIDKFYDIRISSSINFTVIRFQRFLINKVIRAGGSWCDVEVCYSGLTNLYDISIYDDEGQMVWQSKDRYSIDVIEVLDDISHNMEGIKS